MWQLEIRCPECKRQISYHLSVESIQDLVCLHCSMKIGTVMPITGFLYAVKNEAMPGLLKIGFTTRTPEERVAELNSATSTPVPFTVVFYFACREPQKDEALAHLTLSEYRVSPDREFFKITDGRALAIL